MLCTAMHIQFTRSVDMRFAALFGSCQIKCKKMGLNAEAYENFTSVGNSYDIVGQKRES